MKITTKARKEENTKKKILALNQSVIFESSNLRIEGSCPLSIYTIMAGLKLKVKV